MEDVEPLPVAGVLAKIERAETPAVARVDEGEPLAGRVAVLPSAFNPPTRAHLALLDLALSVAGVERAAALLSTRNVDKGLYGAPLEHRLGMLLALHEERPQLGVLVSNAARIPDQAAALRRAHPTTVFDFVLGFDTLVRVFERRYYTDMHAELAVFFSFHRLIAANRGDATAAEVRRFLDGPDTRPFAERVVVRAIDSDAACVSSTAARDAVARGEGPRGVPPEVRQYIGRHGLYQKARS
jgi:nicotinic acid mononucleotide adenylyltransferase